MDTLILSIENEKDLGKWQEGSSPDFTNRVCVCVCVCVYVRGSFLLFTLTVLLNNYIISYYKENKQCLMIGKGREIRNIFKDREIQTSKYLFKGERKIFYKRTQSSGDFQAPSAWVQFFERTRFPPAIGEKKPEAFKWDFNSISI